MEVLQILSRLRSEIGPERVSLTPSEWGDIPRSEIGPERVSLTPSEWDLSCLSIVSDHVTMETFIYAVCYILVIGDPPS